MEKVAVITQLCEIKLCVGRVTQHYNATQNSSLDEEGRKKKENVRENRILPLHSCCLYPGTEELPGMSRRH